MNTTIQKNEFGKEGWTPDRIVSLVGKTYVITGATTGTGFQATGFIIKRCKSNYA